MDITPTPADDVARIQESLKLEREKVRLLRDRIDRVREYIYNEFPESAADVQESMTVVADLLAIPMTKDVEVDINIIYRATITMPMDMDIDHLDDFDVEVTYGYGNDIEIDGYLSSIDVMEV
jgi:hypothetical protein